MIQRLLFERKKSITKRYHGCKENKIIETDQSWGYVSEKKSMNLLSCIFFVHKNKQGRARTYGG